MSTDSLTWLLTKNTSSFIVKRNNVEFSREKFNLMNRNCRKYSGLAAVKGLDLSIQDKKVFMTTKKSKKVNTPVKAQNVVPLNKGFHAVAHTITSQSVANYYRADLKKAALARWARLNRLAKIEKGKYSRCMY